MLRNPTLTTSSIAWPSRRNTRRNLPLRFHCPAQSPGMNFGGALLTADVRRCDGQPRQPGERRKDRRIKTMKPRHLLLIGSLTAIAVSIVSTGMAFADDRYSDLPPVRVSQAISAPWVAQLQDAPARPRIARQETRKTKTHYNKVSYQRPATNPAPSSSIRPAVFSIWYRPTARHAATVSASASRGSAGKAHSASAARPNGPHGRRPVK